MKPHEVIFILMYILGLLCIASFIAFSYSTSLLMTTKIKSSSSLLCVIFFWLL